MLKTPSLPVFLLLPSFLPSFRPSIHPSFFLFSLSTSFFCHFIFLLRLLLLRLSSASFLQPPPLFFFKPFFKSYSPWLLGFYLFILIPPSIAASFFQHISKQLLTFFPFLNNSTMFTRSLVQLLGLGGLLVASAVAQSADPLVIKGNHFFYKSNGSEFFIKGIAYQQKSSGTTTDSPDPLGDPAGCSRDIPVLKQLQTNLVRVYSVDPTANHDECMNSLAEAGIYVLADLSSSSQAISRNDPEWNLDLFNRYTAVVNTLAKYTNTVGFFAGNEVTNTPNTTAASAFVKAAVRDMKAYASNVAGRPLYIGYAADDTSEIRQDIMQYFDCGEDQDRIDFFGLNMYEWCGQNTFQGSGYAQRTQEFSKYNIPAFFSEYGCNTPPRLFGDVPALFGNQMTEVWSGGIVYMYFQEDNNYGMSFFAKLEEKKKNKNKNK